MNAQFAGTGTHPANNVLAAVGCSFFTAFHAFKVTFKEKTGVEWNSRISFAVERLKREKRNRGQGTGSDAGTQKGVPVSENGVAESKFGEEEDFATAPFQYHPPSYGARGTLTESETAKMQNAISAGNGLSADLEKSKERAKDHEKVDQWMSGANGVDGDAQLETIDLSSHPETAEAADQAFIADMGKIFAGLNATPTGDADANPVDYNALPDGFEYPFGTDNMYTASFPTDQNNTSQYVSFDNSAPMPDSFEVGTQVVGETQLAEKAQGALLEHLDIPTDQEHSDLDLPVEEENSSIEISVDSTSQSADNAQEAGVEKPMLDLGTSVLGKRKTSPVGDSQQPKKAKEAEVLDSFAEESYALDPTGFEMTNEGALPD